MSWGETSSSSKAAAPPAIRLVSFVSEEQLDEAKRSRGERVEDGTAQRDKPLFQILQENKDKKDAEFNERFKHRPPKALDEDETEFLDKLALSRREYDQQVANEEAEQLRSFHEAVAAQSTIAHELGEMPTVSMPEESKPKPPSKRSQPEFLRNITVSVKPRAKKAKSDAECKPAPKELVPSNGHDTNHEPHGDTKSSVLGSLAAYGDDHDDDESGDER
ncbi:PSME3-interacting protein-like [Triticum dicoccoides]|uniref:PSME3-interacting protein-like n=1 Tax=Triticum dicoccoides TaxID=85692 RepID=UPI00188E1F23|nr:PSME3-interacting protein-like [Triticum dicoccoides]